MKPLPANLDGVCSLDSLAQSKEISLIQIYEDFPVEAARASVILGIEKDPTRHAVVIVEIMRDGATFFDWEPIALLHLFQAVGASALVFTCPSAPERLPALVKELVQIAKIPIGVLIPTGLESEMMPGLTSARLLVSSHIDGEIVLKKLAKEMGFFDAPLAEIDFDDFCEEDGLVAVSGGCAHFIDATVDIEAECDISDDDVIFERWLLDQEEQNWGAIRVNVNADDELAIFSENQYMIKVPLAVASQSGAMLARVVRNFCGIAMYDGTCDIDEELLFSLHRKYGLIIL